MTEQWDGRPPGDAAKKDGWHWLDTGTKVICALFLADRNLFGWLASPDDDELSPREVAACSYLGPCLTPAEVAALRAERDAAVRDVEILHGHVREMADNLGRMMRERDAALAEAARLREALTRLANEAAEAVTMLDGEYDVHAQDLDKCVLAARAALAGGGHGE